MNLELEKIANAGITKDSLLKALLALDEVNENPQFWSDIANDSSFSDTHRRYAVFMLFKRHIKTGISIEEFRKLLGKPSWLTYDDISLIEAVGGEIPMEFTLTDSIFVWNVFPDLPDGRWQHWAIYIKIEGKISREDFYNAISNSDGGASPEIKNKRLLEFALAPDNFLNRI